MIKFEIEKTGKIRKSDGAKEVLVSCKVDGNYNEIRTEIRQFLEIMSERANEAFTDALHDFFVNEIDRLTEDEDDE